MFIVFFPNLKSVTRLRPFCGDVIRARVRTDVQTQSVAHVRSISMGILYTCSKRINIY